MKKKVAVIFGGRSTEHDVSRVSAYSVIKNLDKELFEVVVIGITKKGEWAVYTGNIDALADGTWEKSVAFLGKNSLAKGISALEKCDVAFPVLHGLNGEDGTVQGLFELCDIPYVGCGIFASAACMDKAHTKVMLKSAGIPQCRHIVAYRNVLKSNRFAYNKDVASLLGYPCFVKPSSGGSSVGVHKVKNEHELLFALDDAQKFDHKIIIEEFVDGKEIECAVLGNTNAVVATPGEIKPSKEFYDYEDKYITGNSVACIPAEISAEKAKYIKSLAIKAFKALDCSGLARIDFFLKKDGSVLLNEINTLPGFTDISMYSKMWIAEGFTYKNLLTELINLAFLRKKETARYIGW